MGNEVAGKLFNFDFPDWNRVKFLPCRKFRQPNQWMEFGTTVLVLCQG